MIQRKLKASFRRTDRRSAALAGLLSLLVIAATSCGEISDAPLASDQFDLETVAPADVFAASQSAMADVTSFTYEIGIERLDRRVFLAGVWNSDAGTHYLTGNSSVLSENLTENGETALSDRTGEVRAADEPESAPLRVDRPAVTLPFGTRMPNLTALSFLDRGSTEEDKVIWLKGELRGNSRVYLPGGDQNAPIIATAISGTCTIAISKSDFLVRTMVFKVEVMDIDPGQDSKSSDLDSTVPTSYTLIFERFNDEVEFSTDELVR
ncbi:MAG: hypothetical protein HQ478_07715 [Chloroflexi bacterium]|nr:hypothetical protein [Chloroflexota bacterium]